MAPAPSDIAPQRYHRWQDEDLALAFQAGDLAAGEVLIRRYERFVYAVARRVGANAEAVEEVYVDIWAKLQVQMANYRAGGGFRAFLAAVVRSVLIDDARRARRSVSVVSLEGGSDGSPSTAEVVASDDDLEADLLARERLHLVQRAVGDLPERFREPLLLYYHHGLSHSDISVRLGVPRNTVATRIHRARDQVRRMVDGWLAG